jgi:zinc/manganese transport system ATP-binding protein
VIGLSTRGPEPPESQEPKAPPASAAVVLEEASVIVGRRTVWRGVDLSIDRGAFAAVLGPNGVGKSTLLNVVLGLTPLAGGRATVLNGRPGEANQRIGYLPQRRSFSRNLPVRGIDVVRMGVEGHRWGIPLPGRTRRTVDARVAELVELVGAADYAKRPVGALSGGEQQRLLIAQALASAPELLLLDEPLDSLDLSNQQAVAHLVAEICRDQGVTIVMVAHDVNPILADLDQVVYLAASGAVSGPPSEVINGPSLSALYGVPIEVLHTTDGRLVVVGQPEPPAFHSDRHGH